MAGGGKIELPTPANRGVGEGWCEVVQVPLPLV